MRLPRAFVKMASVTTVAAVLLAGAGAGIGTARVDAARAAPTLPPQLPERDRARLRPVTEEASVTTRVTGAAFTARADLFEYLLDHPEFATHLTRVLRFARYRIWRTPEGLYLDDGWGTRGRFEVVYAGHGVRVMYARGEYRPRLLPDIRGQAVVVIEYGLEPVADGRSRVTTAVGGFVRMDSRALALAGRLVSAVAEAKADKEALRLVRLFAKTTHAVEENPAGVYEQLRQRAGVPARELEEFRHLLNLR